MPGLARFAADWAAWQTKCRVYIRIGSQAESCVGSIPRDLGVAGVSTFLRLLADELDVLAAQHRAAQVAGEERQA